MEEERICRICLVQENNTISQETPETLFNIFNVCSSRVFFYCTSLRLVEGDGLPRSICRQCLDLLDRFYDFKCLVIKSDEKLRNNLYIKIKSETTIERVDCDAGSNNITRKISPQLSNNEDDVNNTNYDGDNLESVSDNSTKKIIKSETKKRAKCTFCHKKYSKPEKLQTHLKRHFNDESIKKYICHKCGIHFLRAENLRSHLLRHNLDKVYACNHCGKKFIQSGNLKTHLIRHSGVKNIACGLCDMQFYVKGDLDKHMRSHSDDKPYTCRMCEKAFKTQSFLLVHNRTHTGERPFACDLCPKKFMSRKDLKNHHMTHTGEKPHKCNVCKQAFIQKCALNRHMKIHEKSQLFIT